MPQKSIQDQVLEEPKPEPVSGEIKFTIEQKDRLLEITVPAEQAWQYYLAERQNEILKGIRSNTSWMLALIVITAIVSFLGMF